MKSHSAMQEEQFLGQPDISAISDILFPMPLWLTPWFPLYAEISALRPFKEDRRNVKTLLRWPTVSALQTIYDNLRSYFTTAAAISVWLITESMLLFTESLIPECPRLSPAGNSLQRRFSPEINTEGHPKTKLMFCFPCVLLLSD